MPGRADTSEASVRVAAGVAIPVAEFSVRFSRSSGPGGQNVNKRDTRVELIFDLDSSPSLSPTLKARARERLGSRIDGAGRLRVSSSAGRSQADNRARALERMTTLLSDALRPPPRARVATKPTKAARERRLADKRRRSERKAQRGPVKRED